MTDATPDQPHVRYEAADGVATITLDRPDRLNMISKAMLAGLSERLLAADADPAVRAVILTGAGRMFCAGLDLGGVVRGDGDVASPATTAATNLDLRHAPPTVLFHMGTPVICALNGSAAGYGLDLALGCDIRIAADDAKLSAAFTRRGIVPESGGTWLLPRLIGWSRAAELIFTGRTLSADDALALGLVSRLVPRMEVGATAQELAQEIAASAPLAVQAAKRMMRMGLSETFPDHVHHVFLQLSPLLRSADAHEGMQAFMQKREPVFIGR